MVDLSPEAVAAARKRVGIDEARFPKSLAIIMDGNGRWASERGLPRHAGHEAGAKIVRRIVTEAAALGLGRGRSCDPSRIPGKPMVDPPARCCTADRAATCGGRQCRA